MIAKVQFNLKSLKTGLLESVTICLKFQEYYQISSK
jgi:hypothetical protein